MKCLCAYSEALLCVYQRLFILPTKSNNEAEKPCWNLMFEYIVADLLADTT